MIDPVSIVAVVFGCFASKRLYREEEPSNGSQRL